MTFKRGAIEHAIAEVEHASSALDLLRASRNLASLADPAATETLITILGYNNPGAAVAAVEGLVAIGEPAVEPILNNLDSRNYGARAWAVRALSGLRDVRGLEVLVDSLLTDVGPSVRRAAARGLGDLNLSTLPEGDGTSKGSDTQTFQLLIRCLDALRQGAKDGEWVVRFASVVGLERRLSQPPNSPTHHASGLDVLERRRDPRWEEVPVVRERALRALKRLGA